MLRGASHVQYIAYQYLIVFFVYALNCASHSDCDDRIELKCETIKNALLDAHQKHKFSLWVAFMYTCVEVPK